jgi:hypothetical protein
MQERQANEAEQQWTGPSPPPASALDPLTQLGNYFKTFPDSHNDTKIDEVLRVADYLFDGNLVQSSLAILDEQPSKITQFTAPSGRSVYLVKGSKRETYLCLRLTEQQQQQQSEAPSTCCIGGDYCSCRSFFEKQSKTVDSSSPVVCKHLLALALMKPLQCQPNQMKLNSEEEFAYLVLERMSMMETPTSYPQQHRGY